MIIDLKDGSGEAEIKEVTDRFGRSTGSFLERGEQISAG